MTTMKHSFPELEDLKRRLGQQIDVTKYQLSEMQKQFDSVETTLRLLKEQESTGRTFMQAMATIFPGDLHGLTQLDALVKIAKANHGRLKLAAAKDLLLRSGVTKSRKNANNIIFNVIKRSEKFRRVVPGEYELIGQDSTPSAVTPERVELENVARLALSPSKPA